MTFFSIAARVALVVFVLGIGACSSTEDPIFYGYEEDFAAPEPNMVPVTPDDKPGRTVDEMLNLTSSSVTVKKKENTPSESRQLYEHAGRFGSKEKISLRKGLNAPDSVLYGSQKRKEVQEVRSLEVKKQEKDELQAVSEEEMLTSIITPKTTKLELIEVVPVRSDKKTVEPYRSLPQISAQDQMPEITEQKETAANGVASKKTNKYVLSVADEKISETPTEIKQEEIVLLKPPVMLKDKEVEFKKTEKDTAVLLKQPASVSEKVVLTPPQEEIILLKKPGVNEDDSSVEIFLDE